jgi:myo-inositol-1(or 4)-monophosphatase
MSASHLELMEFAYDIAREVGRGLMRSLPLGRFRGSIETKAAGELVSSADHQAEKVILARIASRFPEHAVLAEESGAHGDVARASHRWVVDPLDGTTNYLHGHPVFATSIAVEVLPPQGSPGAERHRVVAAVVHLPYLDETFFAAEGEGAYINSRTLRLATSSTAALDDALVATGFAYDRQRYPNEDNFLRLLGATRGVRRCGAAAVDLAYVAAGRYDAFWERGLRPHDVAAGALLVREAGGRVGDFGGGEDWFAGETVIASNAALFEPLQRLLR